jgi:hypothetical protein
MTRMFQSVEELSQKLSETGYFIDPTMTKVVFLADQMKKPLLLEGPAGSGKTQRVEGLRSCQLELKPSCCQIANSLIEIEVHLPPTPGPRLLKYSQ